MENYLLMSAAAIALVVAGWFLRKLYEKYAPSEKALALKAATATLSRLAKLNSPSTADAVAAAAAAKAHEDALMTQLKATAASLT